MQNKTKMSKTPGKTGKQSFSNIFLKQKDVNFYYANWVIRPYQLGSKKHCQINTQGIKLTISIAYFIHLGKQLNNDAKYKCKKE